MSTARGGYAIIDEPRPGKLAHLVVDPMWPLFATLMVGSVLSLPWFVLNAFAVGSPSKKLETWLAVGSAAATLAFLFGMSYAVHAIGLPKSVYPYLRIGIALIKVGFAYAIYVRQQQALALYSYFGGTARTGALVLMAGIFARTQLDDTREWVFFFSL